MKLELTLKAVILAIILTTVLAVSNAYLALKLGLLTSASIPAAIISMSVLRLFKRTSILENNAVQTAASAGEAVAGGIVYTIPALIIIGFWQHFDYLTNFFIALSSGVLGVLFSIPLRKILVHEPTLAFPEGRAIAEILKSSERQLGVKDMFKGGFIGAGLEWLQTGFQLLASSSSYWVVIHRTLLGFSVGFSAAMIGAGFLVGFDMALSIFIGALLAWVGVLPVLSRLSPDVLMQTPHQAAEFLWNTQLRYVGIGAMLLAGIWTFVRVIWPLLNRVHHSYGTKKYYKSSALVTEKDLPNWVIGLGTLIIAVSFIPFFYHQFPFAQLQLGANIHQLIVIGAIAYVLIVGLVFSVITAYLSGMVGVSASPGSSVVIAGMLFAAWLLLALMHYVVPLPLNNLQINLAQGMAIIVGGMVTGIAAIANDNSQDLKVGQLVGATPWKQQLMLLLGVLVASLVIPVVMEILLNVYGIAGVLPHAGMSAEQTLPAPTAALIAAITDAVYRHTLPWPMLISGGLIIIGVAFLAWLIDVKRWFRLSILGVAIGMYLPVSSSFPLFLGGLLAFITYRGGHKKITKPQNQSLKQQKMMLIACGLVAGAALSDVVLAIIFSLSGSPQALSLVSHSWHHNAVLLSILATLILGVWIKKTVNRS
ncbi:MAG: oligopeptide transporter, OPT family [Legionellaceae bacterium]|nr:oligopeptide transporter, OPT family [Legionellaceae bacterium]HAF87912.1 oligopeptide transporter, OPT family [Legionellales bacterium]HCA90038.1 oligopeptide transporter, OPT family [Legionellales bacterium]|tara:strand:+ start:1783 stop:3732 length:1950 start_codon:yes stop_codon:yes gene_type:complete